MFFILFSFSPAQQPVRRHTENIRQGIQLDIRNRPLLPLQQRQGRHSDLHAPGLQLRQQLHLFRAGGKSGLRYPAPTIFRSPSVSRRGLITISPLGLVYAKKTVSLFGNTKYNKINGSFPERRRGSMTFLIITEDPARAAGLAKRIKEQSPDSFCFPVVPSAVEEALRTIRVDCAVCPPALAAAPVLGNAPCLAV